jgi:iron complex outermembrane recepter protein
LFASPQSVLVQNLHFGSGIAPAFSLEGRGISQGRTGRMRGTRSGLLILLLSTSLCPMATAQTAARDTSREVEMPATVEVIDQRIIQELGIRTTTDVAKAAAGVTGGDAPGAPAIFSMRGFSGDQISTLYNGIQIGPSTMTGRPMDVAGLQRVEIIKGPDSLVAGLGATGGAINYVTKAPHTGPVINDAFTSYDSFNGYRAGYGSGGSTLIDGLDYRFDISHFNNKGFITTLIRNSAMSRVS